MIFHRKIQRVWCLVVVVFLALICSCLTTAPPATNAQSRRIHPKDELITLLKGANVDGFDFAAHENDAQAVAMLTNNAVRSVIKLGKSDSNLVLKYTSVRNKKTNTTKLYKAEVVKKGKSLSLVITDLGNQVIIKQIALLEDDEDKPVNIKGTGEDCFNDFNCGRDRAVIQCQVNQTCESVTVHLTCCPPLSGCVEYVVVVNPTPPHCEFLPLLPWEGLVITP